MLRIVQLVLAGVFGVVCAALVALCIRSHFWADVVFWPNPVASAQIVSMEGRIKIVQLDPSLHGNTPTGVQSYDAKSHDAATIFETLRRRSNRHGFGILWTYPAVVCCPHWFPILTTGALAAVLGIKRMRRFSLRFMLFLTAMVAILLAIIVRP